MSQSLSSNPIRWRQVFSLAAVQGVMSLSWIAYGIYLPKFIEQVFSYSRADAQKLAAFIFVIESAIGLIVEPFFGILSDRLQRLYGSKLPLITVGVLGATTLFIGLPCIAIFGGSHAVTQTLLLGVAILWAIAMATFRSPVLSLLGQLAGVDQLPMAAAALTFVGGLVASIRPLANEFIISLGAPLTFAISSITFLICLASLRSTMAALPTPIKPGEPVQSLSIKAFVKPIAIVFWVGAMLGLGTRLLMGDLVSRILKTNITDFTGLSFDFSMGLILITQALLAVVTAKVSQSISNRKLMMISLGAIAVGLGLWSLNVGSIGSIIILLLILLSLSAVNNGMVPFALTMVPQSLSGLIVGIFFAGISGSIALLGYLVPESTKMLTTSGSILLTTIALLSAGLGILYGSPIAPKISQ
jgi:MFS family permease